MSKVIKAKYTKGVFTPLEPVRLRENEVVDVTVPEPEEDGDDEAFLSSAGGWRDLVPEEFINDVYGHRLRGAPWDGGNGCGH